MNDIASLQRSGDSAAGCSGTQPCLGWEAERPRPGNQTPSLSPNLRSVSPICQQSRSSKAAGELPSAWLRHRNIPGILQAQRCLFGVGAHRQQSPADGPTPPRKRR